MILSKRGFIHSLHGRILPNILFRPDVIGGCWQPMLEQVRNDALVEGALTGIIGGLLIGIIFIAGFGALSAIID